MRSSWFVVVVVLVACGPGPRTSNGDDVDAPLAIDGAIDANPCPPPSNVAGPDVQLAPPYDALYQVYDLGQPPGVPNSLGGTVISASDPNTLLIAGASERQESAIYALGVTRDPCGHIIGFSGTASFVASTPYVDASLVYVSPDLLVYPEWPQFHVGQLASGSIAPDRRTDVRTIGMDPTGDSGPSGMGRVPPTLGAANQLRLVTWPGGRWFHVDSAPDGNLLSITGVTQTATLPNQPGGFAYVPAGSPGFSVPSMIVSEWRASDLDRVVVYEVDDSGDPKVATRREFFSKFPRPWGAYFEPLTGDYLFLSWGTGTDRVYVVQGFVPPPPIL